MVGVVARTRCVVKWPPVILVGAVVAGWRQGVGAQS